MLTTKNTEAAQAIDYFTQSYYEHDQMRWFGQGAQTLGLEDEIDNVQIFANICHGLTPDGTSRLGIEHKRAAIDCTFSAPKSLSLSALVGEDKLLIEAHRKAVENTLTLIEQNYTQTRIRFGADRHVVSTANIVVASFEHIESRELDPHLHSHCLVMNLTRVPNGSWYSLHNGEIYRNRKYLGISYQNHLAQEVQKLGYEIKLNAQGQFELKGYKRQDLIAFSTRNQQITSKMTRNPTWQEREDAWSMTRKVKRIAKPQELKLMWREQAAALGVEIIEAKAMIEIKSKVENARIRRSLRM